MKKSTTYSPRRTPVELEAAVLVLAADGHQQRAIASNLGMAKSTVQRIIADDRKMRAAHDAAEGARAPGWQGYSARMGQRAERVVGKRPASVAEVAVQQPAPSPSASPDMAAVLEALQGMGAVMQAIAAQVSAQKTKIDAVARSETVAEPGVPPVGQDCKQVVRACDTAKNERVLLISDLHAPYNHPDALGFLKALQEKHKFDHVVGLGDETDFHFASYHEADPDLDGAGRELDMAREFLWELESLFPNMDLVDSNHGSMAYRKAKSGGLPRHVVRHYRDQIFGVVDKHGDCRRPNGKGDGWRWHNSLMLTIPNSELPVYVVHGLASDARNAFRRVHTHFAQGHYHTEMHIRYEESPVHGLLWGLSGGCLIDDQSRAFAYNRTTAARPAIGCAGIINGAPMIFPMFRDRRNRWTGVVP